jgi:hypothetical protein
MTIPIAPIAGLAAGMIEPITYLTQGNFEMAANKVAYNYTGYNMQSGGWEFGGLMHGAFPLIIGVLIHKFIGGRPLNVNATLAKSRVPFIRI